MTLDDLVKILRMARNSVNKRGEIYDAWEINRAGVAAVVRALQDEIDPPNVPSNADQYIWNVMRVFNEILSPPDTKPDLTREPDVLTKPQNEDTFDLIAHLQRQSAWSEKTFGPGTREAGVIDHIKKELIEVSEAATIQEKRKEWIDVVILALDGAWRSGMSASEITDGIEAKQLKNEGRTWPDWRTAPTDRAIEHDRTVEADTSEVGQRLIKAAKEASAIARGEKEPARTTPAQNAGPHVVRPVAPDAAIGTTPTGTYFTATVGGTPIPDVCEWLPSELEEYYTTRHGLRHCGNKLRYGICATCGKPIKFMAGAHEATSEEGVERLPPPATHSLVQRLRELLSDEETLKVWDRLHAEIIAGDRGDSQRQTFESILDQADEERAEAADEIERLTKRAEAAEAEVARLREALQQIYDCSFPGAGNAVLSGRLSTALIEVAQKALEGRDE